MCQYHSTSMPPITSTSPVYSTNTECCVHYLPTHSLYLDLDVGDPRCSDRRKKQAAAQVTPRYGRDGPTFLRQFDAVRDALAVLSNCGRWLPGDSWVFLGFLG